MGVVVRRYIDILIIIITFPCSTCISSASLLLCSFLKCFSFLFMLFLYKIEFTLIYARVRVPRLPCARYIPRDISRKLQLTLCAITAS